MSRRYGARYLLSLILFFGGFILYSLLSRKKNVVVFTDKNNPFSMDYQKPNTGLMDYVAVHLDFKGTAPKIEYLEQVFPLIRAAGANALLVEYEDMFPFKGKLANLSSANAFSIQEIIALQAAAQRNNLLMIPLIQTWAHLEFALKLSEWRSLREYPNDISSICPSQSLSILLIAEMIDQILEYQEQQIPLKFLHLGFDEVWHLNQCPKCQSRKLNNKELLASHINTIVNIVRSKRPDIEFLIWDDMLRGWKPSDFKDIQPSVGTIVQPVVWEYSRTAASSRSLPPYLLHMYGEAFKGIWVASAFKGAGESRFEMVPDFELYIRNNVAWARNVAKYRQIVQTKTQIRGVILTGWSRFEHCAPLCETLPVSIPSLIFSLTIWQQSQGQTTSSAVSLLRCPFSEFEFESADFSDCLYPGSELYRLVLDLRNLRKQIDQFLMEQHAVGHLGESIVAYRLANPWKLEKSVIQAKSLQTNMNLLEKTTRINLLEVFGLYTTNEWILQNVTPWKHKVYQAVKDLHTLQENHIWRRRYLYTN